MDARGQQRRVVPKAGTLFAGKYRLERPLARGGMGLVYLALQEPLGRRVAVKVLQEASNDCSFRERFMSEASICAQLSHPHIVTIHDYGQTDDGALFMVMEYVQGETLDRILGREVRLNPDRAIGLVKRVGAALAHAHRAGIVHRDLKPSNIVLTQTDEGEGLKVLDFGIAKAFVGAPAGVEDLTEAGKLIGTPRFMAPEQIRKQRIDQRADLYALGVLSYLVAAGRPPFEGESDVALMNAHLEATIPALPGELSRTEPELDFLVRWLMQKRPEARPQTAEDLLAHMEAAERFRALGRETVLRSSSRVAHSSGALQTLMSEDLPSGAAPNETRRLWGLALALVLLPLLILGVLWLRTGPNPPGPGEPRETEAQPEAASPKLGPQAPAMVPSTEASSAPVETEEAVDAPPPVVPPPRRRRASPPPVVPRSPSAQSGRPAPARAEPNPAPEPSSESKAKTTEPANDAEIDAPPPLELDEVAPARKKVPVLLDDVESPSVPVVD